jgi:hypothetical protein
MRKLDEQIAEWRTRMAAGGIKTPAVLDELEGHLREEIRARIMAGATDEQAFREALARLGSADSLRNEFSKVHDSGGRLLTWSFRLWLGVASIVAIFLARRLFDGRVGTLLAMHIFLVTTSYLSAFMAGGFAAGYVCTQWSGEVSSSLKRRLSLASIRFLDLAAVLIVVGFILGLLWTDQHYGRYWTKNVREIGGLTGLTGLVALAAVRRFARLNEETRVVLGLGASLVVGFAWFGMLLVAQNRPLGSWWPLEVYAGIHFVLIVLNFVRRQRPAAS